MRRLTALIAVVFAGATIAVALSTIVGGRGAQTDTAPTTAGHAVTTLPDGIPNLRHVDGWFGYFRNPHATAIARATLAGVDVPTDLAAFGKRASDDEGGRQRWVFTGDGPSVSSQLISLAGDERVLLLEGWILPVLNLANLTLDVPFLDFVAAPSTNALVTLTGDEVPPALAEVGRRNYGYAGRQRWMVDGPGVEVIRAVYPLAGDERVAVIEAGAVGIAPEGWSWNCGHEPDELGFVHIPLCLPPGHPDYP